MPPRIFKRQDGYEPKDLMHFGLDHVNAAEELLGENASFFDSAGYLVHMGLELLLKAWHLESFGEFSGIHSLKELVNQLKIKGQQLNLSEEENETLKIADAYGELRYPNPQHGTEIGSDDWEKIDALLNRIWEQMPQVFDKYIKSIDPTRKGGRVLMERKIESRRKNSG